MAIRAVRAYRSVSYVAATLLARMPPLELMAIRNAEVYRKTRRMRERLERESSARVKTYIKKQAEDRMMASWDGWLREQGSAGSGLRVREALQPRFRDWVGRSESELSFRMTQIMTSHGCFGAFLHRIGRDNISGCQHCDAQVDSAQHTLEECVAWRDQREMLNFSR